MQHIAHYAGRGDTLDGEDPALRDEVAMWTSFFTGDFHPAFWPYFTPFMYFAGDGQDALPAIKSSGIALVRQGLGKLDAHLEGRDTLVGTGHTIVDAYSVPMLRWAGNIEEMRLADFPNAQGYYRAMAVDIGVIAAQGIAP